MEEISHLVLGHSPTKIQGFAVSEGEHERFRDWFESSGQYPHIARLMKAGIDPDDPATRDERFQFSLDCVLDGVAARIALAAREPKARDSHLGG